LFSSNLNHSGYSGDKEYQFGTDNIFHVAETESENKTVKSAYLFRYDTYFILKPIAPTTGAEPRYMTIAITFPFLDKQFNDFMESNVENYSKKCAASRIKSRIRILGFSSSVFKMPKNYF
jgi:hypothetical protein